MCFRATLEKSQPDNDQVTIAPCAGFAPKWNEFKKTVWSKARVAVTHGDVANSLDTCIRRLLPGLYVPL